MNGEFGETARRRCWPPIVLVLLGLLVAPAVGRAEEAPASLALAQRGVDACRGTEHAKRMRVVWPAIDDETPPDGAAVVLVRGYISYEMIRMVFRDGKVEAGSVSAARSWFYNQEKGESFHAWTFDVDAERFVATWNAARRILGASDERIEPAQVRWGRGGSMSISSHESADWIRVRGAQGEPPVHRAGRASRYYHHDDVRWWDGLRDQAVFEIFEELIPEKVERPAALESWSEFGFS